MNTSSRFVVAIFVTMLIASCASSGGEGSAAGIPYHPKPGKGLVIIYRENTSLFREGWVGRIVNFRHIYDNGRDLGKLSDGTFFLDQATPGTHAFTAKDTDEKTTIHVEAGKTYFILAELDVGVWTVGETLRQVDFSEGAEALQYLEKADE
ncbi:MAG: DUF2846 domain-containing protein [Verrucomicrobiaceae bacterium]